MVRNLLLIVIFYIGKLLIFSQIHSVSTGINTSLAVCYKAAAASGRPLETKHVITALNRGTYKNNWLMERKGAWTVLESKEKGFVINRVPTTASLSLITNPIEGMMVYDEQAGCLKIYTIKQGETVANWHCFNTQTCPDN
ncbi:hypothetical protein OF897_15450 [Chryseobacterium formosus]|uniref:Uncharacterized protein n=1 Tax=Chryseobacterium formosus TaxID=1537363 RepID=A0ABT3XUG3_9FLAO|nr:hypothetical protein [Chryseobacterium formosus]MCX8525313.1 hypothetical protein [Chryseobacterium formosus]